MRVKQNVTGAWHAKYIYNEVNIIKVLMTCYEFINHYQWECQWCNDFNTYKEIEIQLKEKHII